MSANWLMRRRETLKRPIHFVLSFCRYILDVCTTELRGTLVRPSTSSFAIIGPDFNFKP